MLGRVTRPSRCKSFCQVTSGTESSGAPAAAEMPGQRQEKQGWCPSVPGALPTPASPGLGRDPSSGSCSSVWPALEGLWGCSALPNSEPSPVVSGTAGMTSMARTHGKSWTLESIAGSLICLPVMGMRFNYLFPSPSIYWRIWWKCM